MHKIRLQGYIEKRTDWGMKYWLLFEEPDGAQQFHKELVSKKALLNETLCKQAICECIMARSNDVEIEIPSYIRFHDRRKKDAT